MNGVIKFQRNEFVGNATGEKVELKNSCKMLLDKMVRYEALREFGKLSVKREGCVENSFTAFTKTGKDTKNSVETNNHTREMNNDALKMQRPLTSGGNRNMQDSSFSLSGKSLIYILCILNLVLVYFY